MVNIHTNIHSNDFLNEVNLRKSSQCAKKWTSLYQIVGFLLFTRTNIRSANKVLVIMDVLIQEDWLFDFGPELIKFHGNILYKTHFKDILLPYCVTSENPNFKRVSQV